MSYEKCWNKIEKGAKGNPLKNVTQKGGGEEPITFVLYKCKNEEYLTLRGGGEGSKAKFCVTYFVDGYPKLVFQRFCL